VNDSRARQFSVSDGQRTYRVDATRTHRTHPYSARPILEWQFYIEELNLILVQSGKYFVSIDDAGRIFQVVGERTAGAADEIPACVAGQRASDDIERHRLDA